MAATQSQMLPLGTAAPEFDLPDPDGRHYTLADFDEASALVVAFICNHCPFVKHIRAGIAAYAKDYAQQDVAMVAINANDIDNYPADAPPLMRDEARTAGYTFPYLYDETQEVAKNYLAACTPDFYLFNRERQLAYRGQFDGARPGNGVPVTGADLRAATDAILAGQQPVSEQVPALGCNIKWKAGNAPDYF
ncbi:MAG: thioredoxin family protein [Gammaproteobacteria bacterium]|nr:thioredoxin family protein [Gammaproteobacteria bacterium]